MPKKPEPKIKPQPFKHKPTHKAPYNTTAWRKLRAVFLRDNPVCNHCKSSESKVLDHIQPVRLGGEFWNVRNLQALCTNCHNKKSGQESKLTP